MSRKDLKREREALRSQDYLIDRMSSWRVPDFLDVMREILDRRSASREQYDFEQTNYVLGIASRMLSEDASADDKVWDATSVTAIGYVDYDHYPGGVGMDLFCQEGTCSECGLTIISVAKNSICPHCGDTVYCT